MTVNVKPTTWNDRWGQAEFAPFWLNDLIPEPVVHALETGVLNPGDRLLGIGCGAGHLAAHLAEQGLCVTAIDIAENAIARATTRFNRTDIRLTYKTADFCSATVDLEPTDAVVDCGCFHQLRRSAKEQYISNLARCLMPGGTFLLMHKLSSANLSDLISDDDLRSQIQSWFEADFDLNSQTAMMFGHEEHQIPGLGFVLRRHRAS